MSDPARYRTREEVQMMRKQHDCIENARQNLEALGVAGTSSSRSTTRSRPSIQEAADFAQNSPEPDPSELYTDVLLEG